MESKIINKFLKKAQENNLDKIIIEMFSKKNWKEICTKIEIPKVYLRHDMIEKCVIEAIKELQWNIKAIQNT